MLVLNDNDDEGVGRWIEESIFIVLVPSNPQLFFFFLQPHISLHHRHFSITFLISSIPFFMCCELSMPFPKKMEGARKKANKNSLPFFANKLDFYSTPLARSRYLPPDGSFSRFESCVELKPDLNFFIIFSLAFFLQHFF